MFQEKEQNSETGLEIAVIGMAGRFPDAKNIHEFWNNLKNGVESITFFLDRELEEAGVAPALLKNSDYVKCNGTLEEIEYFDSDFFDYTPRDTEIMDPQIRLFHECAWTALEDAGYFPETYKGLIGVYAGASANFLWEVMVQMSGETDDMGYWISSLLMDKDYLSTRISYKFNLRGPAVAVQSACSTSLVAIHMACQAVLSGECDMALAGGVSVTDLYKTGHLYQEGSVLSPDGHCRAFDAKAGGIIGANGLGVVVLKKLSEALSDGDYIYAVVKATAINNDGFGKVGFTAPSIQGEAEAIVAAQEMAEVEPESITYIETHGTATNLGDPVEVEALKLAFNTDKKGFCSIGSIKSNMGHLDAAAGVASFIKAVLALKYKMIPPSLHYEKPNPKIDFKNSPFYVNHTLTPWKNHQYPLRAGVSSFGLGGTNAHVVLQEAPEGTRGLAPLLNEPPSRQYQLILLSAKTESALDKITKNLSTYLKENPNINLADTAYTLQVGRKAFDFRKMLVCVNVKEAVDALENPESGNLRCSFLNGIESKVVFMFSGQGPQYVNMGWELYQKEPVFREQMDRCLNILEALMGPVKHILYPGEDSKEADKINHILYSGPIKFIFDYSMAKLLMKWGIKPQAMIGHSFGEYVAACLSGVFSLEDALTFVILRGRMMSQLPPGAMLSVPVSEEEIEPYLNDQLSLAAVNAPSLCNVSGTPEAVRRCKRELGEKGHECVDINVSCAGHSQMMDPLLPAFRKKVSQVTLNEPQIPFISGVTGKLLTTELATDPGYWARHMRETVRFKEGINELINMSSTIFVQVGAGRGLTLYVKQHGEITPDHLVIDVLRNRKEDVSDVFYLLDKLGDLWLWGQKPDWREFYQGQQRQRASLPTYPFEPQRFWKCVEKFQEGVYKWTGTYQSDKMKDLEDWFYVPSWQPSTWPKCQVSNLPAHTCWLVFLDECGIGTQLVKRLEQGNQEVIRVTQNRRAEFIKKDDGEFTLDPYRGDHYDTLIDELRALKKTPGKIFHLWGITGNNSEADGNELDPAKVSETMELGFYSLINLAKAIGKQDLPGVLTIGAVTNNVHQLYGQGAWSPGKATVIGPVRTIPAEYPGIGCFTVDIDIPAPGSPQETKLLERLISEMTAESQDQCLAFRGNYRLVETLVPVKLPGSGDSISRLREQGVYLITGGLGGIGLVFAKYLARTVQAKLILVGRSAFPPKDKWEKWLSEHGKDNKTSRKIQEVQELEKIGAQVIVASADVSNPEQMRKLVTRSEHRFGAINGVIHSAMVVDGAVIARRTRKMSENAVAAKILGTLVLDRILKNNKLDFFVLCSSMASFIGSMGEVGYCAGNVFQDAYALYKNHGDENNTFTVSINWSTWQEVGQAVKTAESLAKRYNTDVNSILKHGILPEEGIEVFKRMIEGEFPQIAVQTSDIKVLSRRLYTKKEKDITHPLEYKKKPGKGTLRKRPELKTPYVAPAGKYEEQLARVWQIFFGIEKVGVLDDFFALGGDSLKAIILIAEIHKALDVKIPLVEIFQHPCIRELADYIDGKTREAFSRILAVEKKDYYVLSSAQKRQYILQQLELDSIGYNVPMSLILQGPLDYQKLEDTFRQLLKQHESLRTSFHLVKDEPVQRVLDYHNVEFEIEYYDLKVPGAGDRCRWEKKKSIEGTEGLAPLSLESATALISSFIRPFDLSRAPLLRVGLTREEKEKHILMVDIHHIVTDGTSNGILSKEFMNLYKGEELAPLDIQYKDFSEWQQGKTAREPLYQQEAFWLKRFEGEIPVSELPTDYVRPVEKSFKGQVKAFALSLEASGALRELARQEDVTMYILLLTVFYILLFKLSGSEDIVVGTPVANRRHADLQPVIGMFVNTLAMRNYPRGDKTFLEFLREVKTRTIEAFENQDYQFEELVERLDVPRDTSRNPLFEAMFAVHNMEMPIIEIPQLKMFHYPREDYASKFDITMHVNDWEQRLSYNLEYSTKLFKTDTIQRIANYLEKIVSSVTKIPGQKISAIDLILEQEKEQILYQFNDTAGEFPAGQTIQGLFQEQVRKSPDHTALIGPSLNWAITYKELNRKANQLAPILRQKGTGPDKIVGLMAERSFEMVIAVLAILKAGGAFLPIDPQYPDERKKYILEDSRVNVLLINDDPKRVSADIPVDIDILDIRDQRLYEGNLENPGNIINDSHLVYVIYTSGSTGKPKGVMLEHRNIINLMAYHHHYTNIDCSRVLQFATISFDASVHEIFSTLLAGGILHLPDKETRGDIAQLFKMVKNAQIKTLFLPMSLLRVIFGDADYIKQIPGCIEHIQTAGEQVIVNDAFKKYLEEHHVYLHNHYGPSETHVVTALTLDPGKNIPGRPSIGTPISNTRVYILDSGNHLLPVGVPGELCIGGVMLGRGYLNKPELIAEKFIEQVTGASDRFRCINKKLLPGVQGDGFLEKSPPGRQRQKLYKTGDLAKWLPDGKIDFLGRIDHQVKIRGFRVEPGEIETQLLKHEQIKETVVLTKGDKNGEKFLCAYIVCTQMAAPAKTPDIKGLRDFLSQTLPDYMIPAYFIPLDKIPITPNGKVNRRLLPEPAAPDKGENYLAPRNELEKKLTALWTAVLHLAPSAPGIKDNFFQLGGHSLKATILISRIHKEFDTRISLGEVFKNPTIEQQANMIRTIQGGELTGKDKYMSIVPLEKQEHYDASYAQQRVWVLSQVQEASKAFNMPVAIVLTGELHREAFAKAFTALATRHESLRTLFLSDKGNLKQKILSPREMNFQLEYIDLRQSPSNARERETKAKELVNQTAAALFDLSQGPLLRALLLQLENQKYLFLFNMHHIIGDFLSNEVLTREVFTLYNAFRENKPNPLPPLRIHYKDYTGWQNNQLTGEYLQKHQSFWLGQFEIPAPLLLLPTDKPRPEIHGYKGDMKELAITGSLVNALIQLSQQHDVTLFMTMLAALKVLLFHYTGQTDIVIGTPIAGRQHADLEGQIGFYLNTLALRTRFNEEDTFEQLLAAVKKVTLAAFQHQAYPFDKLVKDLGEKREINRHPLFDVMVDMQEMVHSQHPDLEGILNIDFYETGQKSSKFDLCFYIVHSPNTLNINFEYNIDLFHPETIERMTRRFLVLLEGIAENPHTPIVDFKLEKARKMPTLSPTALQEYLKAENGKWRK